MMQEQTTQYFPAVGASAGPLMAYQDGSLGVHAGPLRAYKDGSLGQAVVSTSPVVVAARAMQNRQRHHAANGLGQIDNMDQTAFWIAAAIGLTVFGALSYQAGKAMSPNRKEAATWGWVGVPVGMITGPLGLGIMGIVSNAATGK